MVGGVVAAWFSDLIGGVILVLGFAAFWIACGVFPGIYLAIFPFAGLLHLLTWMLSVRPPAVENTPPPSS